VPKKHHFRTCPHDAYSDAETSLYNPETMPANLKAAHAALDETVDAARVAFLFKLYGKLT
jgi:hypothetical protein